VSPHPPTIPSLWEEEEEALENHHSVEEGVFPLPLVACTTTIITVP
jgi:hypothetical protein